MAPVFKKGKKGELGNYGLVSLTSVPGRVMELLILNVVSKRLEEKENGLLSSTGTPIFWLNYSDCRNEQMLS